MKSDEYTKKHWEEVYTGKSDEEVSWFEGKPSTSLDIIASLDLPKDSSIIDIGGGNSNLISHLLKMAITTCPFLIFQKMHFSVPNQN